MNNYINNLLARHTQVENNVKPRKRSRFEPIQPFSDSYIFPEQVPDYVSNPKLEANEKETYPDAGPKTVSEKEAPKTTDDIIPSNFLRSQLGALKATTRKTPFAKLLQTDTTDSQWKPVGEHQDDKKTPAIPMDIPFEKVQLEHSPAKSSTRKSLPVYDPLREIPSVEVPSDNVVQPKKSTLPLVEPAVGFLRPETGRITDDQAPFDHSDKNLLLRDRTLYNAPTIHVTIGRIEVRAVPQKKSAPKKKKPTPQPNMSLNDYLKKQGK